MTPQIDIDKAIVVIVEAALPVGSTEALYIRVDLRGSNPILAVWKNKVMLRMEAEALANDEPQDPSLPEDDYPWPDELRVSRQVHFLVYRPDNYTHVYATVDDSWQRPPAEQFKLVTAHDSCWRDGFSDHLRRAFLAVKDDCCPKGFPEFNSWTDIARVKKVNATITRNPKADYGPERYFVSSITDTKD